VIKKKIFVIYLSEFKQRNKGHFASIVRLALPTGFAPKKRVFRQIIRLEISAAEYEEILENLQIIN
jgi:hypothetical protein